MTLRDRVAGAVIAAVLAGQLGFGFGLLAEAEERRTARTDGAFSPGDVVQVAALSQGRARTVIAPGAGAGLPPPAVERLPAPPSGVERLPDVSPPSDVERLPAASSELAPGLAAAPEPDARPQPSAAARVCAERAALDAVRAAVLSGDEGRAEEAIERFNRGAYPGGPIVRASELDRAPGVSLRPSFYSADRVALSARNESSEPCHVLVAPGTMVRAERRYQDVIVLDLEVLSLAPGRPDGTSIETACAEVHDAGPQGDVALGIDAAVGDPRLQRLAAFAAREGSDHRDVQLAVWAVANRLAQVRDPSDVSRLPAVRALLELAGCEVSDLPLFQGARGGASTLEAPARLRLFPSG